MYVSYSKYHVDVKSVSYLIDTLLKEKEKKKKKKNMTCRVQYLNSYLHYNNIVQSSSTTQVLLLSTHHFFDISNLFSLFLHLKKKKKYPCPISFQAAPKCKCKCQCKCKNDFSALQRRRLVLYVHGHGHVPCISPYSHNFVGVLPYQPRHTRPGPTGVMVARTGGRIRANGADGCIAGPTHPRERKNGKRGEKRTIDKLRGLQTEVERGG